MKNALLKNVLAICLLVLPTFTFQSCTEECTDALADLTTEVSSLVTAIQAGEEAPIGNLIKNVANAAIECATDNAGESESRLRVDYDEDENGTYGKNTLDNYFAVPAIAAGSAANENYDVVFNDPGTYRLITFADAHGAVSERNEGNNQSVPDVLIATRSNSNDSPAIGKVLIIKVLPNPNFVKPAGAPSVEVRHRTVTVRPL